MKRKILIAVLAVAIAGAILFFVHPFDASRAPHKKHASSSGEIVSFHLQNGMEVVLVPNHRIPAISHTLWVKAGAADDPAGKSGLAHYLEHLMFKGTPTHPSGDYESIVEGFGGEFNAFTGSDYTGYYVTIAKEHLEQVMALESDRMQHLSMETDTLLKERDVIIEERKSRVDNQPRALLSEAVDAALFRAHPYRTPIIGWLHEMQQLTPDDARAFYRLHYQPAHMVLVVAGDIDQATLAPLAEKYYGAIKAPKVPVRNWSEEPPQRAERVVRMHHPLVQQPVWLRTYMAPSLGSGDNKKALPLELLAQWLGGGKTSLLYRELVVNQKIATAVSVNYSSLSRGPARFTIAVSPAPDVSGAVVQKAVNQQLTIVRHQQIAPGDLERIKTLLKAEAIYARDGLEPVAQVVGVLRVLDLDVGYFTQWPSRIEAVTADAIRDAAKSTLRPEQSVTAQLLAGHSKPKTGASQ